MFKVKTVNGTTYNYIESWKVWQLDESFIEFTQKGNLLIIPKH